MRIKKENGFAGTDIAISVMVVTIFIAMIANMIANINLNSSEVDRKTKATSYAMQEIEKIKAQGIQAYIGKGIDEEYIINEDIIVDNEFSGYHKTIIIKDYVLIKQDTTKQKDILKEVTVEISYKVANNERNVVISTYITEE